MISFETYIYASWLLFGLMLLSGAAALFYLVTAFLRWRRPDRNRRFLRGGIAAGVAVVSIVGANLLFRAVEWNSELSDGQLEAFREHLDIETLVRWKVRVGDPLPEFTLQLDDGRQLTPSTIDGRVYVLNFFATDCGVCLKELPNLQGLWEHFETRSDFGLIASVATKPNRRLPSSRLLANCSCQPPRIPTERCFSYLPRKGYRELSL